MSSFIVPAYNLSNFMIEDWTSESRVNLCNREIDREFEFQFALTMATVDNGEFTRSTGRSDLICGVGDADERRQVVGCIYDAASNTKQQQQATLLLVVSPLDSHRSITQFWA